MLAKISIIYDRLIHYLLSLASVLLFVALFIVGLDVIFRYLLSEPLVWATEITEYILLYSVFLGAAWILRQDRHVRMDILLIRLNPRQRQLVNTITSIIGAMICLVITWKGIEVTLDNAARDITTISILKTPMYVVLLIIPLGNLLLSIEFMRHVYNNLKRYINWHKGQGEPAAS